MLPSRPGVLLNLVQSRGQPLRHVNRLAVKEVGDVNPQCVSDEQQVAEFHLAAGFHALDRRPVEAAGVGEGLLRHVLAEAAYPDAVAGGSAGVEDPLGLIGWHPANALPTMIISQQQICGILRS
jgi:hypothetical protein